MSRAAAAAIAAGSTIGASAAVDAGRRTAVPSSSLVLVSSIRVTAAVALSLHGDGRLGGIGGLALQAGRTARRFEHVE